MKKIFSLFLAVACCSMAFGQIISVTDGTLSDWDNVPSDYLFKTECAPNASMNGLKSVQVYVDLSCINLLVEVNDEVITDREWTPFHVFINSDNSSSTGGYGDLWKDADTDLVFETAIFYDGAVYPYNPAVFKWWGPDGENGWFWTDPEVEITHENGWGALVPEGSLPIGNSQMVEDGKIEIQLNYTLIPFPFDSTTFTLGFDIQQSWNTVGVLPNANKDANGDNVLAEKLRVNVHQQNKTKTTLGGIQYRLTSDVEPYTAEVLSLVNREASVTEIAIPETIVEDGITYTVTSIGSSAFSECSSLLSITIPESVTSIGGSAFSKCSSLTSIVIPNGVTSIGSSAFSKCTALTSVTIPESVTSIGDRAFEGCSSLTSIVIPNGVTSIGSIAFSECTALTSVTIPESVTSIGGRAFSYCSGLTSVTIPESVTNIGAGAFSYCSSLTSVTIPEGVAIIEPAVFVGCTSLSSITIPESVVWIGHWAFKNCSSLTSITIPNSVTNIGEGAFAWCASLNTVICHAVVVPSLDWGVFNVVPTSSAVLYVPAESIDDYKAADQWKEFGTILPLEEAPSAVDNVEASTRGTQKLLRNGQLVIIRNGVEYTIMGAENK